MEASIDVLRERGCTSYVLEVLDSNLAAIELYRGLGFRETRRLQCWSLDAANLPEADQSVDVMAVPSWQNSDASVARARDEHVVLGDESGSVVLFPNTGDLPQLRGRITTSLLRQAAARAGKPLRMINLDERDRPLANFLERAGAVRTVRQLEMLRP